MTHSANPPKSFEIFTTRLFWENTIRLHYGSFVTVLDRTGMVYALNPAKRLILGKFRDIPNTPTDIGIMLLRPAVITRKLKILIFEQETQN